MSELSRGTIRINGFSDAEMEFQLLRQLGSSRYGGASVGECFAIVNEMKANDPVSWVKAFAKWGHLQRQDAQERAEKKHFVSARDQFLLASNSFRAAEYYSPCENEEHRKLGLLSRECFQHAMQYSEHDFESLTLNLDGENIPVYIVYPYKDRSRKKTIIIVSGFDGTLEEEYCMRGLAGLERGYNVVLMAGPGQMDTLRLNEISYFKPDYEKSVSLVVQKLAGRKEIDYNKLALCGISFGGYFATRAACYEPRIRALVANSPIIDLYAYMSAFSGIDPINDLSDSEDFSLDDIAQIPEQEMSEQLKAQTASLISRFGQKTFKKTFKYLKKFTVENVLGQITCPTLALIGEAEGKEPERQSQKFVEKTNADEYRFSNFTGASMHCQVANPAFANAVMYDWLDEVFKW
ncbi:dipeptidyl aminopeptidase/acylaminoacyl peptidase [Legionella lansingensis]|uniref:Dipeptidyl aminopeptidase/acylaminoacyl peptidase n=1 Tax=Legionella lansingensis TaxID=45067 RepID=A0A0W0VLN8_9GAMM|nr:alpha/beta hydrolase [Legionella lansingensis]KTD21015.1 dipeptidyl aminopeptidase/acylaminoacyl peptidase [Legionella lansingensis]SNV45011.1 dipeptidyl aminopeptidase/acylaminoacyl peptidase [Legionella lansingensis]